MAGEVQVTVIGAMCADPALTVTQSGASVANFTVASNPRLFDKDSGSWKDGPALFMRCSLWRDAADHAVDSLSKGDRVIVTGKLRQRDYEKDGQKRTVIELDVDEIGPSLKWARAVITKQTGGGNGGSSSRSEPAASGGDGYDQPPF